MNRSGRQKLAFLLAASMLLALFTACGKKDDTTQQLTANVYVPKYLDLNLDIDYINDGCSDGEYLYLIGEKDEEFTISGGGIDDVDEYHYMRSTYNIYRVSLADGSAEKLPNYEGPAVPEGKDGGNSVSQIALGEDGTIWVTERVYVRGDMYMGGDSDGFYYDKPIISASTAARADTAEPEEEEPVDDAADGEEADIDIGDVDIPVDEPYADESYEITVRRQLDKDGNELSSFDMSSLDEKLAGIIGEDSYINTQSFDSNGNLYVGTTTKIYALNNDLSVRFSVEGEEMWNGLTPLSGGMMGMQRWDYDEETETGTNIMMTVDPEKQDWGVEYTLPSNAYNFFTGGGDYLFYYQMSDSIFGFKAGEPDENGNGSGTAERLFSWIEADIDSSNVQSFFFLPDGRVAAVLQEWDPEYEHMTASVAILTSTPRDQLPEKTSLVYATLYLNYRTRKQILDFNKQSENYRIEVKDYSEYMNDDPTGNAALQKLNTEILAGNVPDILDTTSMPVRQYGAKDILEDLWPFIDKDPDLGRDALMIRPLQANQQDGKLYQIFSSFNIRTVVGATGIVGDRHSWTLQDLQDALAQMPDGAGIFGVYDTKENMLNTVVSLNMDRFVDWKTGECSFDSQDFKALLEFCNSFPAEFSWDNVNWDEWEEEEGRLMTGKQMLLQAYLYNFDWSLQRMKAVFNGAYSFVGYPKEDGACGSSFEMSSGGVAMTSSCRDKDGAWEFMRQTLLPQKEENSRYYYYGDFPINKAEFDRMIESVFNDRWVKDADGNPMLDDDGNPIPVEYGTMWVSDEVQIELGPVEQEDIDRVMDLYNDIDSMYRYDEKIMESVTEVATQYFAGDKPLDEAASLIQNKVKLYVGENM